MNELILNKMNQARWLIIVIPYSMIKKTKFWSYSSLKKIDVYYFRIQKKCSSDNYKSDNCKGV